MKCYSSQNSKNIIRKVVSLNLTYREIEKIQKAKKSNSLNPQNREMYYLIFQPMSEIILETHGHKINTTAWMADNWNKELEVNQAMIEYSMIPIFSFFEKVTGLLGSKKKYKYSFSVCVNLTSADDQTQDKNIKRNNNEIALNRRKSFVLIQGGK